MAPRSFLGVLTPSSNTRLEPLTVRMLEQVPEITAHFSRFRVVDASLDRSAVAQFDTDVIVRAAELLADARVDAIVWSGTSGGWIGLDADRRLCERISEVTGVPTTTSTLALLEVLDLLGVRTLGLVTPYPAPMQAAIIDTLAGVGIAAVGARPLGITSNWALSEVSNETLSAQVAEVAQADAVCTFCTNLNAADLVPAWEARYERPVIDTVAAAVWGGLRLMGVTPSRITGWGRLFEVE